MFGDYMLVVCFVWMVFMCEYMDVVMIDVEVVNVLLYMLNLVEIFKGVKM